MDSGLTKPRRGGGEEEEHQQQRKRHSSSTPSPSQASSSTPFDASLFTHTPFYCEENVYLLCKKLCAIGVADPFAIDLFVVFISNENRQVPLWCQKASKHVDGLVLWDYHVICIQSKRSRDRHTLPLVWDLDSSLPVPFPLNRYSNEVVRPSVSLHSKYKRLFRVVHAPTFLRCFASDRRHMKDLNGNWQAKPPTYDPIVSEDGTVNNLDEYIRISSADVVANIGDLVTSLFSSKLGVMLSETQFEIFFSLIHQQ
ncbi:Protein N-terminal glutamine amidohydrolase [Acorus gramineus]|uniref:Protein N-terminal glutamine amidohydrolase n=1 Tax=Acorus gramineus TaxID=55184 RepID=A0AAV9BRN0_ACOGR|nr:Protein N-terminal glutamine amidohydrolase [Acorus gramineus]